MSTFVPVQQTTGEEDHPLAAVFALLLRAAVEVRSTGARGASHKKKGKRKAGGESVESAARSSTPSEPNEFSLMLARGGAVRRNRAQRPSTRVGEKGWRRAVAKRPFGGNGWVTGRPRSGRSSGLCCGRPITRTSPFQLSPRSRNRRNPEIICKILQFGRTESPSWKT